MSPLERNISNYGVNIKISSFMFHIIAEYENLCFKMWVHTKDFTQYDLIRIPPIIRKTLGIAANISHNNFNNI